MKSTDRATPLHIAIRFSTLLWEHFPKEMRTVVDKVLTGDLNGSCPTHDFCDANMFMANAFRDIVDDISDDNDFEFEVWNKSWDLCHAYFFFGEVFDVDPAVE